jgi:hypothetical protein
MAGRVASLACGTLLIYISFLIGKRVFRDPTKAVWTACLVAFHPLLIRYSGSVLSESATTLFFALAVFLFYIGWQENKRIPIIVSGACLLVAYFTRPEYIVFYVPLALLLLKGRRFRDTGLLLLPFVILGAAYICYLQAETGLWIVSKKATLSPFVGLVGFFHNIPFVAYEFFLALSPLFFVLAIIGCRRVDSPYRNLVLLLVLTHILSLSFVSHAGKRYSLECAFPLILFSVEGVSVILSYFSTRSGLLRVASGIIALILFVGVWQSYVPPRANRILQKQAGLFIRGYNPGSVIASRYPIVSFYARGKAVSLFRELSEDKTADRLRKVISEKSVEYLIVDEVVVRELPFLHDYLSGKIPVKEFRLKDSFVQVFLVAPRSSDLET